MVLHASFRSFMNGLALGVLSTTCGIFEAYYDKDTVNCQYTIGGSSPSLQHDVLVRGRRLRMSIRAAFHLELKEIKTCVDKASSSALIRLMPGAKSGSIEESVCTVIGTYFWGRLRLRQSCSAAATLALIGKIFRSIVGKSRKEFRFQESGLSCLIRITAHVVHEGAVFFIPARRHGHCGGCSISARYSYVPNCVD